MSEKIYLWLWRLFPSQFQATYAAEALLLLRDRLRDEAGFLPRLRLSLELLADLMISVPRLHRLQRHAASRPAILLPASEAPAFRLLATEPVRARAFLLGAVLSLCALGAVSALPSHPGLYRNRPFSLVAASYAIDARPMDAAWRHRVIQGVIASLNEFYVYPEIGQQMADALLAHEKNGDDDALTDPANFATTLTTQARAVSHDRHLRMIFSASKTPASPSGGPTPEDIARYRQALQRNNCGFEKVAILPHNIGYLKFNEFPDPAVCKPVVERSMKTLNNVDAIIFDLRDNGGGDPHMVSLICSYLFDTRTHLNDIYDRPKNTTQEFWTADPVPGNKLSHVPAYVLTSGDTFSGAEEFCYDLKNLKRATLIGETTGGGAHLVQIRRIDEHFAIGVPFGRPINPISKKDWEGTGVQPDVKTNADDALRTAQEVAKRKKP